MFQWESAGEHGDRGACGSPGFDMFVGVVNRIDIHLVWSEGYIQGTGLSSQDHCLFFTGLLLNPTGLLLILTGLLLNFTGLLLNFTGLMLNLTGLSLNL
ncbi:MAG TPA: hypothetical protein VIG80_16475, partial [Bacillaceae bacterium]